MYFFAKLLILVSTGMHMVLLEAREPIDTSTEAWLLFHHYIGSKDVGNDCDEFLEIPDVLRRCTHIPLYCG